MTRKIGIIGVGHVGGAIAHSAVVQGVADDYVLIDTDVDHVEAEALDLTEAQPNLKYHANITVNDWSALDDADVVISSVGKIALQKTNPGTNSRFIEVPHNVKQVKSVAEHLLATKFHGVLIVITNPNDIMVTLYQKLTGYPQNKVIGTGTLLDTARMLNGVGQAFHLDARSVSGYNLGEHGNSQFTAWSNVKILDHPIIPIAEREGVDLADIEDTSRNNGHFLFQAKGYTNYAIAGAAIRLTETILSDSHSELPVSNLRPGHDVYLSYPAVVGREGILQQADLDLTDAEEAKLSESYKFVSDKYHDIVAHLDEY
ncbi:NAD(P)-binding domain-containing protein [Weissella viridescens]|uniref:lactate/malate family dehydrogenase n=1 Tax=Weissella viridescens TaxID=1629 RepID=UPI001D08ED7B|nr:NAD(P)-binding domain-containing protein [Weissella viridescens]MCB6839568.1 NAD(P)-binding domain-containing protein [Weissella viridescens]MCB6846299.1 NAD(P)-binding domain-containing protein [Weissella viridescens]